MSKLWVRLIAAMSRRGISLTIPRAAAKAVDGGDIEMDPMEHATGIEKRELLALAEGKDPYHTNVVKRGSGTKDNPTLIPSVFDIRMVGCYCRLNSAEFHTKIIRNNNRQAQYMWLEKGTPKRCACGHWFKIKEVKPL